MKKLLLIAIVACLSSCGPSVEQKALMGVKEIQPYDGLTVVQVDSCEYVCFKTGHGVSLIHKQNCKFCKQRNN